jgi:hypothetical protein
MQTIPLIRHHLSFHYRSLELIMSCLSVCLSVLLSVCFSCWRWWYAEFSLLLWSKLFKIDERIQLPRRRKIMRWEQRDEEDEDEQKECHMLLNFVVLQWRQIVQALRIRFQLVEKNRVPSVTWDHCREHHPVSLNSNKCTFWSHSM